MLAKDWRSDSKRLGVVCEVQHLGHETDEPKFVGERRFALHRSVADSRADERGAQVPGRHILFKPKQLGRRDHIVRSSMQQQDRHVQGMQMMMGRHWRHLRAVAQNGLLHLSG